MASLCVTNWLLLGILLALAAHLSREWGSTAALAGVLPLEPISAAITTRPNDKPVGYVHVVPHSFSGD